jgi:hypothetical protein
MPDGSTAVVFATKYARALDIAVVVVVAVWHFGGAGFELVSHLPDYPAGAWHVVVWTLLTTVILLGAVLLLRHRMSRLMAWAPAGVTLAASTWVAADCPHARVLETDWAWGTAGWIGVLLLLRRPLRELIILLCLEALATFAVLVARGMLDRHDVAGFLTTLYASVSIQLAVAVAARALDDLARRAAASVLEEAETTTRQIIADQVHAARQARYAEFGRTLEPLLHGVADGSLDPGDPAVRRRCAIEAARLRRLFAESDDVPDPLIHEIRACADIAERRGVVVDIETAGAIPPLPPSVRRDLTEAVIGVLAAARDRARVTVTAGEDELAVGLLTSASAEPAPVAAGDRISISRQCDDGTLWMEARWQLR